METEGPGAYDPESVKARYLAERDRRLVPGRTDIVDLRRDERFARYTRDPFTPYTERDGIDEELDVVVVGGGIAGLLAGVALRKAGVERLRIVDQAGGVGGTWYWNRYPGCMCDVESYTYLPLLEETGYMPTEKYASAPEIFAYCQLMGRHFELYPHALFHTEIDEAEWDDEAGRWRITTNRGDHIRARFFVTAGGILAKPKLPGIPGIADYAGEAFHTSRWNYAVTGGGPTERMDKLADKRVGIIGTGATAVQVVPQLATTAKEVYVFQRTPSAVGERNNGPTDVEWFKSLKPGWQQERIRNFTQAVTGAKPEVDLVKDGWTEYMWEDTHVKVDSLEEAAALERSDFESMEKLRRRVDAIVEDPETAAKLKPWYGKHCKRMCFHDEYLPSFNRPNVHLVDTDGQGVERITADGVVVAGEEYPVDVLVFASGYEVTTELAGRLGFDPKGRGGLALSERWSDGPHTLYGVLSAEFPNMFMIGIVQAGFGTNFLHFLAESAKHVAWTIATCEKDGVVTIEADPEAEEDWWHVLLDQSRLIAGYSATCTPGYYNSELSRDEKTLRNLVYTGSILEYAGFLEQWRDSEDFPGTKVVKG